MAVALVRAGVTGSGSSAPGSVANCPNGLDGGGIGTPATAGNLLLVEAEYQGGDLVMQSAGYTLRRTDDNTRSKFRVWQKIAAGGETGADLQVQAANTGYVITLTEWSDVDPITPISSDAYSGPASGAFAAPSVIIARNGGMLVTTHALVDGNAGRSWTPPAGMTEAKDSSSWASNFSYYSEVNYEARNAGATGTRTATFSATPSTPESHNYAFALQPPNTAPTAPVVTAPNGGETINNSTTITWTAGTDPQGDALTYDLDYSRDNGANWVAIAGAYAGTSRVWDTSAIAASTAVLVRIRSRDPSGLTSSYDQSNAVFTIQHNVAPLAPTPTAPPDNGVIDRTILQRFAATFNDPDAGDSSSRIEIQYRLVGAGSWTTVSNITTNRYYDFAANTFAAGNYEWQVRYYDAQGVVGPYSASRFFTAATPPATPAITSPINGSTIGAQAGTIDWSTALAQTSYQVRKLVDVAGAPADPAVPANVYYDSGEVVSTTARNAPLTYPVNSRYEHLQVRIKVGGLWSAWASVRVQVSYTPPATPTITFTQQAALGALDVIIVNPVPTGTQPATTSNEVWVDEGAGEKRYAKDVPTNSTWRFRVPRSGDTLQIRVRAIGANGVNAWSV